MPSRRIAATSSLNQRITLSRIEHPQTGLVMLRVRQNPHPFESAQVRHFDRAALSAFPGDALGHMHGGEQARKQR